MNIILVHFGNRGGGARFLEEISYSLHESHQIDNILKIISSNAEIKNLNTELKTKVHEIDFKYVKKSIGIQNKTKLMLSLFKLPIMVFSIYKLSRNYTYCICTMPHPLNIIFTPIFKILGKKYISILHELDTSRANNNKIIKLLLWLECSMSAGLITLNSEHFEFLRRKYPKKPLLQISHGPFRYGKSKMRSLKDESRIKLLFFGRIDKYKGLDILLDAFEYLKHHNLKVNYELSIVGNGILNEKVIERIESNNRITLINRWIKECEIEKIFLDHDILVLPYISSTQSGVASIAKWLCTPIICTPTLGLINQVKHGTNGFIAGDFSGEELANQIQKISKQKEYEKISSATQKQNIIEDSWDNSASKIIDFLQNNFDA